MYYMISIISATVATAATAFLPPNSEITSLPMKKNRRSPTI